MESKIKKLTLLKPKIQKFRSRYTHQNVVGVCTNLLAYILLCEQEVNKTNWLNKMKSYNDEIMIITNNMDLRKILYEVDDVLR